jgi:hypothetical protein
VLRRPHLHENRRNPVGTRVSWYLLCVRTHLHSGIGSEPVGPDALLLATVSIGAQAHAATAVPVSRRLTKQMSTKVLGSAASNEKAAERPKSVRSLIVNEMLMTEQTCALLAGSAP